MALKFKVMEQYCKSCGYCVHFCPKQILVFGDERNAKGYFYPTATDLSKCIGCGICAKMCPDAAIEIREEAQHG